MLITTAYFDRSETSIEGFFTLRTIFRDPNNIANVRIVREFKKLPARSGQKGFEKTSWQRGKSPIPWTRNSNVQVVKDNPSQFPENLWIWLRIVLQEGQWAGDKGIGEFRYISSSLTEPQVIRCPSNSSLVRYNVGIHPENNFKGCLPLNDELEVLTNYGWKKAKDITLKDRVAQLYGKQIVFDEPLEIIKYYETENLIKIYNRTFEQITTKNHRILYKTGNGEKHNYIKAKDITFEEGNRYNIPACGLFDGFKIFKSLDHVKLFTAILADGHFNGYNNNSCIFHFRNERKIQRMKNLLERLNITYEESENQLDKSTYIKIHYEFFDEYFKDYSKNLNPNIALLMSLEERTTLIEEARHWDGSTRARTDRSDCRFAFTLPTTNETHKDFYSLCCVLSGYRCKITEVKDKRNDSWGLLYTLNIKKTQSFTLSKKSRSIVETNCKKEEIPYNGYAWCLRTRSTNFCVRQGNNIFFTGNSSGCIVLLADTESRRREIEELRKYIQVLARTIKVIRLEVI